LGNVLVDSSLPIDDLNARLHAVVAAHHTLKFDAFSGARIERGGDYDVISLTYQFRWGRKVKS
jgi:hypothetical protein